MKDKFFAVVLTGCITICINQLHGQKAYFQQDLQYNIQVKLNDQAHVLDGKVAIKYTNNSPDTLREMFFHLWPNAYQSPKSAFGKQEFENGSLKFQRSADSTRGGITGIQFSQDGAPLQHQQVGPNPDICVFQLTQPLLPGGSTTIRTPFSVKIPETYSRLGHVGQQYQICQWYPKPAVYDRDGWHPIPYLDQGEFFSEYGTFDVSIEVPKNYVVGATGDLAANDPELEWIKQREALSLELLTKPIAEARFEERFPANAFKTLHFHQEKVHDFAWFCDKQYYVLADTVALPESKREVRCVAMFTNLDRKFWTEAPRYVAQAIYFYSLKNGDYPYNHATAVDGALSAGAGMEYPNITVLGAGGSASNLEMVTMHEVGHNWYYGILGSNERAYPWMDEGLNTYFEGKYWKQYHGDTMSLLPKSVQNALGINFTHTFMQEVAYEYVAGQGMDQPVQCHSADYTSMNYGVVAYMKSGLVFNYLEAYLGEETTDRCFHAYFNKWKFKHPSPDDIQAVFEETSGKDLDWFFDVYLLGIHKPDFRIKSIKGNEVTLSNSATIALPAPVSMLDKEGNGIKTVWTEPFVGDTTFSLPDLGFHSLRIDDQGVIPEIRDENNVVRAKGIFKHCKPLSLQFLYKYPDPTKANLYLLPAIGYNTTDGFMGGILLYSGLFPKKKYEFHVMPMFGFSSDRLTGSAGFTARWTPSKLFSKIEYHARVSSFATILRMKHYVSLDVQPKEMRSVWRHNFNLATHILANRPIDAPLGPAQFYLPVYGEGVWTVSANGTLGDFKSRVEIGGNTAQRMARTMAEASYTRKIGKKAQAYIRGYAGMILSDTAQPDLFQLRVSGARDPFGDAIIIDRAQVAGFGARQVTRDHGAFSSITGISHNRNLFGLNMHFKMPFPLFSVFADVAAGSNVQGSMLTYYDAGLRLNFFKEPLHINFPVFGSAFGGLPADGKDLFNGVNFSIDAVNVTKSLLSNFSGN